jgi:hypothetical protein
MGCAGSITEVTAREEPAVLNVAPANGTTNIDVSGSITVTFSRAMQPGMEMLVILHEGSVAGAVVAATASWSADRRTLTLTPTAPLEPKTTYVLHLAPTLRGADGVPLNHAACAALGGRTVTGGMIGGGMGPGMMGSGWQPANGTYGMIFTFTTA